MVLMSGVSKQVVLLELTVPWEEWMEEAQERKKAKYADLVTECRRKGWKTCCKPFEVPPHGADGLQLFAIIATLFIHFTFARNSTVASAPLLPCNAQLLPIDSNGPRNRTQEEDRRDMSSLTVAQLYVLLFFGSVGCWTGTDANPFSQWEDGIAFEKVPGIQKSNVLGDVLWKDQNKDQVQNVFKRFLFHYSKARNSVGAVPHEGCPTGRSPRVNTQDMLEGLYPLAVKFCSSSDATFTQTLPKEKEAAPAGEDSSSARGDVQRKDT
ncbi:uncharacterized protein nms [Thalassophryne amazonica]|uniref:uncharacterized protein nms n=1 Tax=Thalassophryne amazonica TaxID=390379 RepID=UPI001471BA98|nr:uncharacterized protein nms [Thalassophryne amazonica]